MDNLTHSLVGALIGQMGLKRKTGLAMPTLIIAANIPDIDAVAVLLGGHQHLAIRRGITHGPIAMVVLPLLLWGVMLWFDRWQARRGKRPDKRLPIHKGWLLALAYIGCLSHPLFDWFNSYGIRLLEPFSSQWFYGDTLFIVDVWIWFGLILSVWISMSRERRGSANWKQAAWQGAAFVAVYVGLNFTITAIANDVARLNIYHRPVDIVAQPVPLAFWKREILWRDGKRYGSGSFDLFGIETYDQEGKANAFYDARVEKLARQNPDVAAFLFWSRMPVVSFSPGEVEISDQRFSNPMVRDRFRVVVQVKR
jgi:inner membrane protein